MNDKWFEPIGEGGIWIKEGRNGKFMSFEMTFTYNFKPITVKGVAFKNKFKEGKKPDWNIRVNDSFPAGINKKKEDENGQGI